MRASAFNLWPRLGLGLVLSWLGPGLSVADDRFTPLDLREVHVGGEIGRRIEVTIRNNLLVLDADRDFLAPFRARTQAGGYIGLGKLIDATVRFAAYSGDPKVLALRKHLVDTIIASQEADGYIGMLAPKDRMHGLWDIHEIGYIIWGLLTDEAYHGDARSLAAARKAADYLLSNWTKLPDNWSSTTSVATNVAVTGLERTILRLYRRTGDPAYLKFVIDRRALPTWDLGIVIGRRDGIEGHVYAYMAESCPARAEPDAARCPAPATCPPRGRLHAEPGRHLITGATGQAEIWTDDQDGRGDLGETCATAYQLRVTDALLRLGMLAWATSSSARSTTPCLPPSRPTDDIFAISVPSKAPAFTFLATPTVARAIIGGSCRNSP